MNSVASVTVMLGQSPYLTAALATTFALLIVEAWRVRGQLREAARSPRDATPEHADEI
ncbi:hypothetical protein [Paraburkholderia sp.]|uniref:hypothetical protein n=1 Tax=Paraburkholderia sp. TaxID=1926495 RepID=UPI002D457C49|nr:hypothetical protein [Paraburkholderia sp.]HZZ04539.1 hypothetical protein [Paraburkholderia sp.]